MLLDETLDSIEDSPSSSTFTDLPEREGGTGALKLGEEDKEEGSLLQPPPGTPL